MNSYIQNEIINFYYNKSIILWSWYYHYYWDPAYMTFSYRDFLELLTLFRENDIYIGIIEVYSDWSYIPPDFYYEENMNKNYWKCLNEFLSIYKNQHSYRFTVMPLLEELTQAIKKYMYDNAPISIRHTIDEWL